MGKSSSAVTGYRYRMSVVMWLYEGAVDEILEFRYSERTVFKYDPAAPAYVPENDAYGNPLLGPEAGDQINQNSRIIDDTTIAIRAYQTLGGDDREGGLWGDVGIHMGRSATPDTYLEGTFGSDVPAYVDCTSLVFRDFVWSANNPYFKNLAVLTRNLRQNWRDNIVWYPSKLEIGPYDMNPAHMIYQVLTSPRFNLAWPISDIDDTNFKLAADQFHSEGFGLSGILDQEISAEDFIQIIASTVNCELRLGETSGKFELVLIRDNYDVDDLTEVGPDNIVTMSSFERSGYGETCNTLTVMYTDRDQVKQPYTQDDAAAITKQGGVVIPTTREYLLIREPSLAARVCSRDLGISCSNLAKCKLTTDRILHGHQKGDVIAFTWPKLGITRAPFRIISIDKKNIMDGTVDVELVEDVFGLPSNSYTGLPQSEWINPSGPPAAAAMIRTQEVNYRDIKRYMPVEQFNTLTPDYCFGQVIASSAPGSYFGFKLANSETTGGYFEEVANGNFSPVGVLVNPLGYDDDVMIVSNILSGTVTIGTYALVDNEAVVITSVDFSTGEIGIGRGVIDTVPTKHLAGATVWFPETRNAVDPKQRLPGTTTYYKVLPTTGYGTIRANQVTHSSLMLRGRAQLPYPPAGLKINTQAYPDKISGPLLVGWVHRDRIAQQDQLIDQSVGSIGPEQDVIYDIRITGESGLVILDTTTSADELDLTSELDPLVTTTIVDAPANRDLVIVGLGISTGAVDTSLKYKRVTPVDGGWLQVATNQGEFINGTTGAITSRTRTWSTETTATLFSVKPGLYVAEYTNDPYGSLIVDPYVGYAALIPSYAGASFIGKGFNNNRVNSLRDRRGNATAMVSFGTRNAVFEYQATNWYERRQIARDQYTLHVTAKSALVSGPFVSTHYVAAEWYRANMAQFESASGQVSFGIVTYTGRIPLGGEERVVRKIGIIFGSLMYVPLFVTSASQNTAGRPLDITNFLTSHLDITTTVETKTQVYSITLGGAISLLATRSGLVIADQVSSTTGVEITDTTIRTVNSSTGAVGAVIATIPGSVKATRVVGDLSTSTFYVLCEDYKIRRYDLSGALLATLTLPNLSVAYNQPWMTAIDGDYQISISLGYVYVWLRDNSDSKFEGHFRCEKDLSSYTQIYVRPLDQYITMPDEVIQGGHDSAVFYNGRILDESALSTAYANVSQRRLHDTIRIELQSLRNGSISYQMHDVTVPRLGYGLRYGESYED